MRNKTKTSASSWHIGVAAEAVAASVFARCGFDVSVQYGANQPEYDLIVARNNDLLKVSVKGSQSGSWGLTQSYLKGANYHGAIDKWLTLHSSQTVMCFVQFKNAELHEMPRIYLATPKEVASRLKETAKGRGDTILYERHTWSNRAQAAGHKDEIPKKWLFSLQRVEQLLASKK